MQVYSADIQVSVTNNHVFMANSNVYSTDGYVFTSDILVYSANIHLYDPYSCSVYASDIIKVHNYTTDINVYTRHICM